MAVNNTTVLWERPKNFTTFTDFMTEYPHNVLLEGWYGPALLMTVFAILMTNMVLQGFNAKKAFAASSFITFILSVFFAVLDIVGPVTWIISLLMVVAGALLNRQGDQV